MDNKLKILSQLSFEKGVSISELERLTNIDKDELGILLDLLARDKYASPDEDGIRLFSLSAVRHYKERRRYRFFQCAIGILTFIVALATLILTA